MNWMTRYAAMLAALVAARAASAHHTYAMFDAARTLVVEGTVAKLEWHNPHVYVWVYVRDQAAPGSFSLYAFQNGSINVLARLGWSKTSLAAGDAVAVTYRPLRDGRPGGHLLQATLADGRTLKGAGAPSLPKALP